MYVDQVAMDKDTLEEDVEGSGHPTHNGQRASADIASASLSPFAGHEFENSLVLFNRVIIEGARSQDRNVYDGFHNPRVRYPQVPANSLRRESESKSGTVLRTFSSFFRRRTAADDPSNKNKRFSVSGVPSGRLWDQEPIHMTLEEVRSSMHDVSLDGWKTRRGSHVGSLKRAIRGFFGMKTKDRAGGNGGTGDTDVGKRSSAQFERRALPPVPNDESHEEAQGDLMEFESDEHYQNYVDNRLKDFASSIKKVKDYGWYWGPLSGETAERILANEPDGSFIVRDSSDERYIFSLTFKLNGLIRHVRIEHDQGNFSFGTLNNFKSHTIVEFIENAVAHSQSGRYLFFLRHRPVLGPMRVQLLYPVSRFKQVQSLQHMCRFVILKAVRRDHIRRLPLPKRIQDYLNTHQYYSEVAEEIQETLASHSLRPNSTRT